MHYTATFRKRFSPKSGSAHVVGHLSVPALDVPVPQMAEQLVEVPTIISYSSLLRTVEQHVDIPVPGGEDPFLVFKVFPLDRVQQRCLPRDAFLSGLWSRSLTLFLVEVFMVLSQDTVHHLLTLQLVLKNAQMSLAKTFPQNKKCDSTSALGVGTALMDFGCLCFADGPGEGGAEEAGAGGGC